MGTVTSLFDGFRNVLLGAGSARDPAQADSYFARALTQHEIDQAYRGSGILRKTISIPALDMVREWRDWSGLDAEQAAKVYDEEKRLAIRAKVLQAEVLRGLGGGALVLGLPGDLAQPAPTTTGKGGLAFIHVVSRWHLTFGRIEDDARLPGFSEPTMWRMQSGGRQIDVHPSRVIPFRADTSATLAAVSGGETDAFWGESRVAQVMAAAKDYDKAYASFAAMLHKARLTRVSIPGMSATMSMPGGQALLQQRVSDIALGESMFNYTIFDGGEDGKSGEVISDVTYDFAGAKDMLDSFGLRLCAVADIPATRLLGTSAPGLNSSGAGEQTDWRKKIGALQTLDLAPCLDRLDRYMIPSALGSFPTEAAYDFAPLDTPGEKENAERFKLQMEAAEKLSNLAAMPEQAFNRGLQSLMIEEGYLPELEQALAEIPEDERYGIVADPDETDDPNAEGGDPASAGGDPSEGEPPRRAANDAWMLEDWAAKTLYVRRDVLNRADIVKWAEAQGFTDIVPDLHVTITYSTTPVDWMKMGESWRGKLEVEAGGPRLVEALGPDGKYKALLFNAYELVSRNSEMREKGASFDWDEYQPHISIQIGGDIDLASVKPYTGKIMLGPEIFEEIRSEAE